MNEDLIIKPDDPRFDRLEEIFSKYNFDNIVLTEGNNIYYHIPKELVLEDKSINSSCHCNKEDGGIVWYRFNKEVIKELIGITDQELFDLVILHINDKNLRPKCICGNFIPFSSIYKGYGQLGMTLSNTTRSYCSRECAYEYSVKHLMNYTRFLSQGCIYDTCQLYILLNSNNTLIKFGVTQDIHSRIYKGLFNSGIDSINKESIKILYEGTRFQVANLELKLKFIYLSEYVDYSEDTYNSIINLVNSTNPNECIKQDTLYSYISNLVKVHLCRGGAPDKGMIKVLPSCNLIKHDHTNLVDYNYELLDDYRKNWELILPADEGDIKYANKLYSLGLKDQSFILLPQELDQQEYLKVIDYDKFVPKDSEFYQNLNKHTHFKYPKYQSLTIEEFMREYPIDFLNKMRVAIKTTTGSGSRGVWLINPDAVHYGGKYVSKLSHEQYTSFIDFAYKENCRIIVQDLIPFQERNLLKCNTDFVIRDRKLLCYKWDITDQNQLFTNWDHFDVIRNEYTDKMMKQMTDYLISLGIVNAIMNFESFSNLEDETQLIEMNYRFSNSMFELNAFNVDFISIYLQENKFELPYGKRHCLRYWQCIQTDEIPNYKEGV